MGFNRFKQFGIIILICFFPIIYLSGIAVVEIINDENLRQGFAFGMGILTFPTNLLIYFFADIFKIYDPYSYYENGIAGTIQFGIIPILIVKYLKKRKERFKDSLF